MRKHYIALVQKDSDFDYGISFPDFPGAIAAAHSLDEAVERAGEALALHVEGMAEDGEPIPPPSGFAEVIKDNPDAMTVLVPFPLARTVQRGCRYRNQAFEGPKSAAQGHLEPRP